MKNLHPKMKKINPRESINKGKNKIKCKQSDKSGSIKQHIEAVHEKIKKHVCEECGYAATRKDRLNVHIEAVHKTIRKHVCGECGYASSDKGHLRRHI